MITYIVILWCVRHLTVSRTLLCPTHYCVKQNTVSTLTQKIFCPPFTFQRAAVVLCACEAPPFLFVCSSSGKKLACKNYLSFVSFQKIYLLNHMSIVIQTMADALLGYCIYNQQSCVHNCTKNTILRLYFYHSFSKNTYFNGKYWCDGLSLDNCLYFYSDIETLVMFFHFDVKMTIFFLYLPIQYTSKFHLLKIQISLFLTGWSLIV